MKIPCTIGATAITRSGRRSVEERIGINGINRSRLNPATHVSKTRGSMNVTIRVPLGTTTQGWTTARTIDRLITGGAAVRWSCPWSASALASNELASYVQLRPPLLRKTMVVAARFAAGLAIAAFLRRGLTLSMNKTISAHAAGVGHSLPSTSARNGESGSAGRAAVGGRECQLVVPRVAVDRRSRRLRCIVLLPGGGSGPHHRLARGVLAGGSAASASREVPSAGAHAHFRHCGGAAVAAVASLPVAGVSPSAIGELKRSCTALDLETLGLPSALGAVT